MSFTTHAVPFERLVDLVEGRLAAEERAATQSHVGACRRCAEQVARLETTLGLMRTDTSEDAPRDAVAYAVSLFRARRAAAERPSLVERIVASLTFDSLRAAPAFGVRSAGTAPGRQLMFAAGERDIDLRVSETGEGFQLSGQVLGECAGGRVEIEGAEGARAEAELNELCEFSLQPVPAGSYRVLLHLGEVEVEVPSLELRA